MHVNGNVNCNRVTEKNASTITNEIRVMEAPSDMKHCNRRKIHNVLGHGRPDGLRRGTKGHIAKIVGHHDVHG